MKSDRECGGIRRILPDYAVGAANARLRNVIDGHIESCPECRAELEALRRTAALVETAGLEAAPDSWDAIRSRIEPRSAGVRRGFLGWLGAHRLQSAVAAVAVFIALGTVLLTNQDEPVQVSAHTYFANHAAVSWTEPFADKAALGLVSAIESEKEAKSQP